MDTASRARRDKKSVFFFAWMYIKQSRKKGFSRGADTRATISVRDVFDTHVYICVWACYMSGCLYVAREFRDKMLREINFYARLVFM